MRQIFLGAVISTFLLSTTYGASLWCITSPSSAKTGLIENPNGTSDFVVNGRNEISNLDCVFLDYTASCENEYHKLKVIMSDSHLLAKTIPGSIKFELNGKTFINYDFTAPGNRSNCFTN